MGTIILTHILTSLNNLLFTRGEERLIQGCFNLNQQKFLLIQIKPPADVTNFEGSQKATKERRVLRQ